jgi:DNA anti-recombination protein RmuC
MENMDKVWALEQAARYAQKYAATKDENQRIAAQMIAIQEALDQAKKEIQYLSKLANTQQRYIEKLEGRASSTAGKHKETTILTMNYLQVVKDDAC